MSKINGRIVDYDNDSPVSNVLVQGIASSGTVFASTNSDNGGNFTLDNQGFDDPYSKISFVKDGYATQTMRPASANNVDVVLPKAGTLASVTLTLKQNKTKALLFVVIGGILVFLFIKYRSKLKF